MKHKWEYVQSKTDEDFDEESFCDALRQSGFDTEDLRSAPSNQFECTHCGMLFASDLEDPRPEVKECWRECDPSDHN